MTSHTATRAGFVWPRLRTGVLAACLCLLALVTAPLHAEAAKPANNVAGGMNLSSDLSQPPLTPAPDSTAARLSPSEAANPLEPGRAWTPAASPTPTNDIDSTPLRLEPMLSPLGEFVDPRSNDAGALARTPSWSSMLKFLYWFALLLLSCLSLRDALHLFHHLLSQPPTLPPSMPHAPWPSISVVVESRSASRLASSLAALAEVDYPAARLKIIVLCPTHEDAFSRVIQAARATLPCRLVTKQNSLEGDVAGRCFNIGIRDGNAELVLVLSDTAPCEPGALKACAERFFDPSLGALLGFLPGASAGDRAIVPRMLNLLRVASQTAGISSAAGMTPGTGLLALRRSVVRTLGLSPTHTTDCFALLRQLERFGSHHAVQAGVIAAGASVHNWEERSRWIAACAGAFAATMSLNPLRWLSARRVVPLNFGMRGKLMLPMLWCFVALGSLVLYFTGNALGAATGIAVCAATAYGVDGMPSAFNATAVLFRVHGRRAEASLVAWAPVMFCHDLMVALRSALLALCQRALDRPISRPPAPADTEHTHMPTQPLEQSTLL
ncbi:MAG TPA: glycosyltransferase [Rhodocyclaceae bacterium]|nr:glycosyltransferase [Rhodocyclaceae bacterium]